MTPKFFASQDEFRRWLEKNHQKKTEIVVGFHKVGSGKPTLTWSESVDQALCFGWIDGVRKSIDKDRYQIRFTPRKSSSIWSSVNIRKIKELTAGGLMNKAGAEAFEKRKEEKSGIYAFENKEAKLTPEFEKKFKSNKAAWKYFMSLAPSYRKLAKSWIMTAKQEATKLKRLDVIIKDSESGTNRWKDNKYSQKANKKTKGTINIDAAKAQRR